jgi:beta-xylosidase
MLGFGVFLLGAALAPIRLAAADPRVPDLGEDFYMVASSFSAMPGVPVLHSKDLVYWTLAGWQALRAKEIYGPWETKVVLYQGTTATNGPHQGGLVDMGKEWGYADFEWFRVD